jgi:hypothetical protein
MESVGIKYLMKLLDVLYILTSVAKLMTYRYPVSPVTVTSVSERNKICCM